MNLPQDKQPIKVEYHYENGDVFFIEGEELEHYLQNLIASGSFCSIHNFKFIPVDWLKGKSIEKELLESIKKTMKICQKCGKKLRKVKDNPYNYYCPCNPDFRVSIG